jgi:plasmid maintenance system antidote protein VapI
MGKKTATIAETLRKMVVDSGEPVTAVARAAGIAQPVLHRFVAGERDLTLRTAEKLVAHFDLELRPRSTARK